MAVIAFLSPIDCQNWFCKKRHFIGIVIGKMANSQKAKGWQA
jgi:hypothetical protein